MSGISKGVRSRQYFIDEATALIDRATLAIQDGSVEKPWNLRDASIYLRRASESLDAALEIPESENAEREATKRRWRA